MAPLIGLIGHASRGLLWLLLLNGHLANAVPAHGKDALGAVSSESKTCSEIGIELLRRGGNAADAMVGTTLCVGVVGMQHSGIGGGGFMLVRDSDGNYEAIDFRETAPAAASEDMYNDNIYGSLRGGLASGVPGDLRGLEYLHKKYGILPWRVVCNPAVHVARHGFRVTEDLVRYMDAGHHHGAFLVEDPQWAIDFAPNGTLVGVGDMMTRKRYANTLEEIAKHGAETFYEGEIAKQTINAIQSAGGIMTLDDLKNYQISIRDPISIRYKDFTLHSCSAPSGGSVALSILKIIEGYEMSDPELRNLSYHRLNEAMRFSYAARSELGDPDFFGYMTGFEAQMLRQATAERIRRRISDHRTHNVSHYSPVKYSLPENHGTSHIVTADASGMSITSTSTVNLLWGSLLVVPETGVIMNDEMNDFSIPGIPNEFGFIPSPINYIAPLKRPLSSISPIIVEHSSNRSLYVSIGAAGGSMIPTSTVQSIWHILEHGMTLPEALNEPRMHDQLMPASTLFEGRFDKGIVDSLGEKGHNLTFAGNYMASVQGVRRLWNGTFEAASEPRQLNSGGLAV
ncbi:gamma-glutamyltranspeptidase [Hyaloscypha finlandica]|nr:gamma-glutamyltranspeptidase [Hyaloscypha finlandica]